MRSRLHHLTHKLVSQMRSSVDRDGEGRKGTESDSLIFNVNGDVTEATTDDDSARRRDTEFSPCALYFSQPRSTIEESTTREKEREREEGASYLYYDNRLTKPSSANSISRTFSLICSRTMRIIPRMRILCAGIAGSYMGTFTQRVVFKQIRHYQHHTRHSPCRKLNAQCMQATQILPALVTRATGLFGINDKRK